MNFDTLPMPIGENAPEGIDEFRIAAPTEIRDLLRQLEQAKIVLHLHGPNGSSLMTTLWEVDLMRQSVTLGADGSDLQIDRLLDCGEIVAVGFLDQVKVQFDLTGAMLVRAGRDRVLSAQLPQELYRFQRRDAFRVRPLSRGAPQVYLPHPSIPEMQLGLRILDVSAGGCALFLPEDVPPLAPGVRINGVRVELDAETDFHAGLMLHHVTAIHADSRGARLGCEWVGMSSDASRALQRFIDQTQKRRRQMVAGGD